jgi:hypothetical protein
MEKNQLREENSRYALYGSPTIHMVIIKMKCIKAYIILTCQEIKSALMRWHIYFLI